MTEKPLFDQASLLARRNLAVELRSYGGNHIELISQRHM